MVCGQSQAAIDTQYQYDANTLTITEYPDSVRLALPGCGDLREASGFLPVQGHTYAIPAGERGASVEIIYMETDTLEGIRETLEFGTACFIPTQTGQSPVQIAASGELMGMGIVQVVVCPIQYCPETQRLVFHRQIQTRIYTTPTGRIAASLFVSPRTQRLIEQHLLSVVENPNALAMSSRRVVRQDRDWLVEHETALDEIIVEDTQAECVIITGAALADSFQMLANWKRQKGTTTLIKTVEDIYQEFPEVDPIFSIRRFLQFAREHFGTLYALVGGDHSVVPVPYPNVAGQLDFMPSDFFYSALDGDWNTNQDWLWGAGGWGADSLIDAFDRYPDIYVGRVPVADATHAGYYVRKVFEYEKNISDATYQDKAFVAGIRLWLDNDAAEMSDTLLNLMPATLEVDTSFCRTTLCTNSPSEELSTIDNGYALIIHTSHGHEYGIDATVVGNEENVQITRTALDNMNCANQYGFAIMSSCWPGKFDVDCIGAHWLTSRYGGGIGVFAPSGSEYPVPSHQYHLPMFMQLLRDADVNPSFGYLTSASKTPFIWQTNYWGPGQELYLGYTLLGDPELTLWRDSPRLLELSVTPAALVPGICDTVHVALEDSVTGSPVPFARLTLMTSDQYVHIEADEDGVFHFTDAIGALMNAVRFSPNSQDTVRVTAFAPGYKPKVTTIVSQFSSQVRLEVQTYVLIDTLTSGVGGCLNNGVPDAGETVEVQLGVWSYYPTGHFTSGYAKVTNASAGIEIIGDSVDFSIGDGYSLDTTAEAIRFAIDPLIPDSTVLRLDIDLHAEDSVWHDFVEFRVAAPSLDVNYYVYLDDSSSRRADPCEQGNLWVRIVNRGSGDGYDVQGALLNYDGGVAQVETATTAFGDLPSGASAICSTAFRLATYCISPMDGQVALKLSYLDHFGRVGGGLTDLPVYYGLSCLIDSLWYRGGPASAELMWINPPVDEIRGYNIYQQGAPAYQRTNTTMVSHTSRWLCTGLDYDSTYLCAVTAVTAEGMETPLSNPIPVLAGLPEISTSPFENDGGENGPATAFVMSGDDFATVIFGTSDNDIMHRQTNGSVLTGDIFPVTRPATTYTVPAIANVDADSTYEMVVASDFNSQDSCFLYAFDLTSPTSAAEAMKRFYGQTACQSPVCSDLEGDGNTEVILVTFQGNVNTANRRDSMYVHVLGRYQIPQLSFSWVERSGWPKGFPAGYVFANPAVGDIDRANPSAKEVVFTDGVDGVLYAYNSGGNQKWRYPATGNLSGLQITPVLADINADDTLEVVFVDDSRRLYALNGPRGTILSGFNGTPNGKRLGGNYNGGTIHQPAIADFDGDGTLEIVAAVADSIFMLNHDGTTYAAPIRLRSPGLEGSFTSPLVGDIDDDGELEIIMSAADRSICAWKTDGSVVDHWPIYYNDRIVNYQLCDVDANGDIELVLTCWGGTVHIYDPGDSTYMSGGAAMPWPMMLHDVEHTSRYGHAVSPPITIADSSRWPGEVVTSVPRLHLSQNYPNPFNSTTRFEFELTDAGHVEVTMFNTLGQTVRKLLSGEWNPGVHAVEWDGTNDSGVSAPSGVYFVRLDTGHIVITKKLQLIR